MVVPPWLDARGGMPFFDILVGKGVTAHVVLQRAISGELHLLLVLLGTLQHQLVRGDVMGLSNLHLEISPFLELLRVARQPERPYRFKVSGGEDTARSAL